MGRSGLGVAGPEGVLELDDVVLGLMDAESDVDSVGSMDTSDGIEDKFILSS